MQETDILVSNGKIAAIEEHAAAGGAEVIDGRGLVAIPGFVNAHVHLNDSPLKDLGVGRKMQEIVDPLVGLKRTGLAGLSLEARADAMSSALAEMVATGVTTAVNFHEEGNAVIKKLSERSANAPILINLCRPSSYSDMEAIRANSGYSDKEIASFSRTLEEFDGIGLSGANEYSNLALEQISMLGGGFRAIHAAESGETVSFSRKLTGMSEVERVMEYFKPNLLVHMTNADRQDIRLAAGKGAAVVCCPRSNAILGTGSPPVREILASGMKIGLGTDNLMINSPDMFREMDFMSRITRLSGLDPAAVASADVLRMATAWGAAAVGISGRTGALRAGLDADIVLIDLNGRMAGTHDICSSIVHRAGPDDVVATIKKGVLLHETQRARRLN